MKRTILAAIAALALMPVSAMADDDGMMEMKKHTVGSLEVEHARLRATPPNAKVAAGYLTVENKGGEADRLIGGSVDFADRIEVHEMAVEDGVMKMRPLVDGLEIAPGEEVELKPGGYHLMLMGVKDTLKEGETRTLTVEFEKAGALTMEVPVVPFRMSGDSSHAAENKGH